MKKTLVFAGTFRVGLTVGQQVHVLTVLQIHIPLLQSTI